MLQDRSHGVHLGVASAAVAAGAVDLFEDRNSRTHAEARSAVGFGDQDRQKPGFGEGPDELRRIAAFAVQLLPVLARKARAQTANGLANFRIGLRRQLDHKEVRIDK